MSSRNSTYKKQSGVAWVTQSTQEMPPTNDSDVLALFQGEKMDAVTTYRLEALSALHERKVAALMRSIGGLRQEIGVLKAQSKEHRRSQLIQQLRGQLREQELAVDVLKEALGERNVSTDQVNELLILRTLGGPRRFRPKSREELQSELAAALKRCDALQRKGASRRAYESPAEEPTPRSAMTTPRVVRDGDGPEELPSVEHLREMEGLLLKLEESQLGESRLDLELAESKRQIEKLRAEKLFLQREAEKTGDYSQRYVETKRLLQEARIARDVAEETLAAKDGELEALGLEMEHVRAQGGAEREALASDVAVIRDELAEALASEAELQTACVVERERAGRAAKGEVAAQMIAESRVQTAERALRDATTQRERAQRKYDDREKSLRQESAESGLKQKRESNQRDAAQKRDQAEQRRAVAGERKRADEAGEKSKLEASRAEILQGHVDALHHELRAVADARADEIAEHETEVRSLTERCGGYEATLERERGQRDVEAFENEARMDVVAVESTRHLARATRQEEVVRLEGGRRARAEAGEAGRAAESALARARAREAKGEAGDLVRACDAQRGEITRLRALLEAAVTKSRSAEKRASDSLLRATYATQYYKPREQEEESVSTQETNYDYYSELYATRAALVALMKLSEAYAARGDTQAVNLARRELERAIASSTHLATFYANIVARRSVAVEPPPPRQQVEPPRAATTRRPSQQPAYRQQPASQPAPSRQQPRARTPAASQQRQPTPQQRPASRGAPQQPRPASRGAQPASRAAPPQQRLHTPQYGTRVHQGSEREHTVGLPGALDLNTKRKPQPTAASTMEDDRFVGDDDGVQYSMASPTSPSPRRDYDAISAASGSRSSPASSSTKTSRSSSSSRRRPDSARSATTRSTSSSMTYSIDDG